MSRDEEGHPRHPESAPVDVTGACWTGQHERCMAGDKQGGCTCTCHKPIKTDMMELADGTIVMSAATLLDLIEQATSRGMKIGGELVREAMTQPPPPVSVDPSLKPSRFMGTVMTAACGLEDHQVCQERGGIGMLDDEGATFVCECECHGPTPGR